MSRDQGRRDKARQTSYHTMRPGCSSEQTKKVFMELEERGQRGLGWGEKGEEGGTGAESTERQPVASLRLNHRCYRYDRGQH